jgi:hypothetical protein
METNENNTINRGYINIVLISLLMVFALVLLLLGIQFRYRL